MKRKNTLFIIIGILLIITAVLLLRFKVTKDSNLKIEAISSKLSDTSVVANLKAATSYNQSSAQYNTEELQKAIDEVSNSGGGIVHIPSGTYYFESAGMNTRGNEDYVIMCKDNVTIEGEGTSETTGTILKPYGTTLYGLDMFYFNDYADSNFQNASYLVNADFRNFIIDSSQTSTQTYTTAGKGFMINLFKDCDWENVKVKNTDGTGFGMDCPINSTVKNCEARGCGKAATVTSAGASGFGIGTGYSNNETIHIVNCIATNNKKFGFFFEHQGRFSKEYYTATKSQGFVVSNCTASGNLYDLGGNRANDVTYENCTSNGIIHFENNSRRTHIVNLETNVSFTDVADNSLYYYEPVYWAVNKGIAGGTSETTFSPNTLCTRGTALMFLWRMGERQGDVVYGRTPQIDTGFSDVTSDSSYIDAIKWAVDEAIITDTGTFSPDDNCTRADFITFLWRYAGKPIVSTKNNFTDVEADAYYEKAVDWAVDKGIVGGISSTSAIFAPANECKRADIVTMIYRYMNGKNEFNITYNLNGGTVSGNPTSYESGSDTFTLKNPTKTGYVFMGWTGSNYKTSGYLGTNNYTPITTAKISSSTIGHLTYTANWEEEQATTQTYTVTVNVGNGISKVSGTGEYKPEETVTLGATLKAGYENITWSGYTTSNTFTMPKRNVTVNVNAMPINYTITYNLNGGSITDNPTSYTVESNKITLPTPSRIGYIFTGWTGSNGTIPQKTVTILQGSSGNKNYTANWEVDDGDNGDNGGNSGNSGNENVSEKLEVQLAYSNTEITNQNVIVIISANNKMNAIEGWELSNDRKSMSKEYEANTTEDVTIVDEYSNQIIKRVEINNIDKEAPKVTIGYKQEENRVIVIINANEEIQGITDWTLSDNKKSLQRIYENNEKSEIVIKDIAGNETRQIVEIKKEENSNTNNNGNNDIGNNENNNSNSNIDSNENNNSNSDIDNNENNNSNSNIDNNKNNNSNSNIDNNKNSNTKISNNADNATSNNVLPQTGTNKYMIYLLFVILLIIAIVSYKKLCKYKKI